MCKSFEFEPCLFDSSSFNTQLWQGAQVTLPQGKVGIVQTRLEWNYCAAEEIIAHLIEVKNYFILPAHCMKNVKPGSLGFRVGLWCWSETAIG